MRFLITGATGFVGRHLIEHLISVGGYKLYGLTRQSTPTCSRVEWHTVDWRDVTGLVTIIQKIKPEGIVHLAGNADAGGSFTDPDAAFVGNLMPTTNLYTATKQSGVIPRILHVSSGAVYSRGLSQEKPCDENNQLAPISPYAASKALGEVAALQHMDDLPIIRVRPFNHIGPGQSNHFAIANFAEQIARIEAGLAEPILETGNLNVERDLTDVHDMVRAYRLLLEKGMPGEAYNAGRGESVLMQTCVDQLISLAKRPIQLQARSERMRPADIIKVNVSIKKLKEATGWRPEIPLHQTIVDVLNDWRQRITT